VLAVLIIPPNAMRISGSNPANLGDINPGGSRTAYWVLVFSTNRTYELGVVASGYRQDNGAYEETYGATTLSVHPRLTVSIISPRNITYSDADIPLVFAVNEPTAWLGYSLDGQANVTITGNETLTDLTNGVHHIVVHANDTIGNMGVSESIDFVVQDTTPPAIDILSPEEKTYSIINVPLTFKVAERVSWIAYSLDGQSNVTINGNTTFTVLSEGPHSILVFAGDMAGNTGSSTVRQFSFEKRHDLAINEVATMKTGCFPIASVGQGYSIDVFVIVENQGSFTETFNVTAYANMTFINTLTGMVVDSGNYTTATFSWNTTGWIKGNYAVSAYAWPVLDEVDVSDNNFTGCYIVVTIPGDVNGDWDVDIFDIVQLTGVYGLTKEDPEYCANCDVNRDGDIDIFDVVIACGNYGETL